MKKNKIFGIGKKNDGFAVAGIVYSILLLFILLLTSLLVMLGNRKLILDGISAEITESIQIIGKQEVIRIGESIALEAKIRPVNITNQMVVWKSSNPSIATVVNGVVTGVKNGSVVITAETVNGMKDSFTLDVYKQYPITNIVKNSGFEDSSTTGLGYYENPHNNFTVQLVSNNAYMGNYSVKLSTVSNPTGGVYFYYMQPVSLLQNHIYYAMEYMYMDALPTTDNVGQFDLYRVGGTITGYPEYGNIYLNKLDSSYVKNWRKLNFRFTSDVTYDYNFRLVYFQKPVNPIMFDNLLLVDLTATFGAGNEPSFEWCDAHVDWFNGNSTIWYK